MARIRTIKPEFWQHEDLSALPEATHMLAAALLNHADDYGYFNANPGLIRAACSPLREPSVSIPESLRSLQAVGYLNLGTGEDGKRYGVICHFNEHQRVSHPTASKIEAKTITWDISGEIPESFVSPPESFRPERKGKEGKGKEQGREERGAKRATPLPEDWTLPDDWRVWAIAQRPDVDVDVESASFRDHWRGIHTTARGRKSDWEATWRNWIRRSYGGNKGKPKESPTMRSLRALRDA